METNDQYRGTSDMLRALSHEQRLQIISHLSEAERSVGELVQLLNLAQPAVSQQLARLRMDGLVSARREGRTIYYVARTEVIATVLHGLCGMFGYAISATRPPPTLAAGNTGANAPDPYDWIEEAQG